MVEQPVDLELPVVPDCPHHVATADLLRDVLDNSDLGCPDHPRPHRRRDHGRGFTGSPSVRINGKDPFPSADPASLSCQLYQISTGVGGVPDRNQLRGAVLAAACAPPKED